MSLVKSYSDWLSEESKDPYFQGLSKSTISAKKAQMKKQAKMPDDDPAAYKELPGDTKGKSALKPSPTTSKYQEVYGKNENKTMPSLIKNFQDFIRESYADDYPKNKYIELDSSDVLKYADNIINLITGAYSKKGGHHDFKNPGDLRKSDVNYWITNDIDNDPEIDIALGGKKTSHGIKMTVGGQDGSDDAKKIFFEKMMELMKKRGFYAEMDINLAQRMNLEPIENEDLVRDILSSKQIKWNGDGSYERLIGDKIKTKIMVGVPKL